jgi:hypothetical protein
MDEKAFVRKLAIALEEAMPGAVVWKHCDSSTAGIPDLSVTWARRTLWLEGKVIRNGRTKATGLQHLTARRLASVGLFRWAVLVEHAGSSALRTESALARANEFDVLAKWARFDGVLTGSWAAGTDVKFLACCARTLLLNAADSLPGDGSAR